MPEEAAFHFCFEPDQATGLYETFASFSRYDAESRIVSVCTFTLDLRLDEELWLLAKAINESAELQERLRAELLGVYPRPCTCTPQELINACTALADAEEFEGALRRATSR